MGKALIVVIAVGLTVYCVFDVAQTPARRVPGMPKWAWFLVALLPIVGPIAWLVSTHVKPRPVRPRPVVRGPDDDADFLRRLDRPEDRALREWEAELRDKDDRDHPS